MKFLIISIAFFSQFLVSTHVYAASDAVGPSSLDMITSPLGIFSIIAFVVAYMFVMAEEYTHFRKSKPVILAATIIWAGIAFYASNDPNIPTHWAEQKFKHLILEFAELFFFLFVAMTFVNALTERKMFDSLCSWLSNNKFSYKKIFWITGVIAFFLSPIADNLTTALILGTVVLVVGKGNKNFITIGMINIVVSANAGGAFSPFGDITTLPFVLVELIVFASTVILSITADPAVTEEVPISIFPNPDVTEPPGLLIYI